ncbi:hypothetical protein FXO38_21835 [Capsicum annuum]|uniref:Uncharacterized protein n=1 Tax=Capsicum annuum TaxID=4072 RepID=A0A2G2ZXF5_CAPAN|nr:hypothetical protein FXO37_23311 [Capsicum annuum]KAF3641022.1 hypothetical protein FXO38_21835 [Capsicum annuum]PHT86646.1 hypothetical protein T459_08752 [Capsicum annuum]
MGPLSLSSAPTILLGSNAVLCGTVRDMLLSLHAFDSNQQGYHGQTVHHGAEWRPLPTSIPVDNFQNLDAKSTGLLQYVHDPHPPNSSQLTDNFVVSSRHSYLNTEGSLTQKQPYSSHMNGQEAPAEVVKMNRDTSL